MKRIRIIIIVTQTLALLAYAYSRRPESNGQTPQSQAQTGNTSSNVSTPVPQTPVHRTATTLRHILVNARTVVDLTKRGVSYDFDPKKRPIDLTRVRVRTDKGAVAISSWLETKFKNKLAGWDSRPFSIGTRPTGTQTTPTLPTGTSNFQCDPGTCTCTGAFDCMDMMVGTSLCGDIFVCATSPQDGLKHCACVRV